MQTSDLTRLDTVKTYLNTGTNAYPTTDDALLGRLITAASKWVQSYLSRTIPPQTFTRTLNGYNSRQMMLPDYPVLDVTAVSVGGVALALSVQGSYGFLFDRESIYNTGGVFPLGFQNVTVTYEAGFQVDAEAAVVPGTDLGYALPVAALAQPWNADRGVTYADGTALVKVNAAPAQGEYAIAIEAGVYVYQLNEDDAGAEILITYGFTPEDIEEVVIELVADRYKFRTRVGNESQNLGNGQVVTFQKSDLNANAKTLLDQYRNVVPLP